MPPGSSIEFPPFRLDLLNQQLWCGTQLVLLRPKPFAVLAYLATHAGRLMPHAELVKAVWPNTYVGEGLLRGYTREVRMMLGDHPEAPRSIETVARRSYRFIGKVVSRQRSVIRSSKSDLTPNPEPLAPKKPKPAFVKHSTLPAVSKQNRRSSGQR